MQTHKSLYEEIWKQKQKIGETNGVVGAHAAREMTDYLHYSKSFFARTEQQRVRIPQFDSTGMQVTNIFGPKKRPVRFLRKHWNLSAASKIIGFGLNQFELEVAQSLLKVLFRFDSSRF